MIQKRVLITGGEGFLGSYLVNYLSKFSGTQITVLDKLLHPKDKNPNKNVIYEKGDIALRDDVEKVFKKNGPFVTIYHLASAMPDKSVSDKETWNISVQGTANVATSAVKYRAKSLIFTSSNVTYGVPHDLPVSEDTPTHPIEAYGNSKVQAEKELEKFKHNLNIQIFRCPVITGVGRLGLQAILFEFISENRNVYLLGSGDNTYQFVDANDVAAALELSSHKLGFDIYVIGGDGAMPLGQMYKKVIEYAKSRSKIISLPKKPALIALSLLDKLNISPLGVYQYSMLGRSMYADTTKIKKLLGWKPKKTNLQSFIENYRWYIAKKKTFAEVGNGSTSSNRSLPKLKIFKLLKMFS